MGDLEINLDAMDEELQQPEVSSEPQQGYAAVDEAQPIVVDLDSVPQSADDEEDEHARTLHEVNNKLGLGSLITDFKHRWDTHKFHESRGFIAQEVLEGEISIEEAKQRVGDEEYRMQQKYGLSALDTEGSSPYNIKIGKYNFDIGGGIDQLFQQLDIIKKMTTKEAASVGIASFGLNVVKNQRLVAAAAATLGTVGAVAGTGGSAALAGGGATVAEQTAITAAVVQGVFDARTVAVIMDTFHKEAMDCYFNLRVINDIPDDEARTLAYTVGVVNGLLEAADQNILVHAARKAVLGTFKKQATQVSKDLLDKALKDKNVKKYLASFAQTMGVTMAAETVTEILQESMHIAAEMQAGILDLSDPKQRQQTIDRLVQTGLSAASATILLGSIAGGFEVHNKRREIIEEKFSEEPELKVEGRIVSPDGKTGEQAEPDTPQSRLERAMLKLAALNDQLEQRKTSAVEARYEQEGRLQDYKKDIGQLADKIMQEEKVVQKLEAEISQNILDARKSTLRQRNKEIKTKVAELTKIMDKRTADGKSVATIDKQLDKLVEESLSNQAEIEGIESGSIAADDLTRGKVSISPKILNNYVKKAVRTAVSEYQAGFRKGAKAATTEAKNTLGTVVNALRLAGVKSDEMGQFINILKQVQTVEDLSKVQASLFSTIESVIEKRNKRDASAVLNKIRKDSKPTALGGHKYGKFTAEIQDRLNYLLSLTRQSLFDASVDLDNALKLLAAKEGKGLHLKLAEIRKAVKDYAKSVAARRAALANAVKQYDEQAEDVTASLKAARAKRIELMADIKKLNSQKTKSQKRLAANKNKTKQIKDDTTSTADTLLVERIDSINKNIELYKAQLVEAETILAEAEEKQKRISEKKQDPQGKKDVFMHDLATKYDEVSNYKYKHSKKNTDWEGLKTNRSDVITIDNIFEKIGGVIISEEPIYDVASIPDAVKRYLLRYFKRDSAEYVNKIMDDCVRITTTDITYAVHSIMSSLNFLNMSLAPFLKTLIFRFADSYIATTPGERTQWGFATAQLFVNLHIIAVSKADAPVYTTIAHEVGHYFDCILGSLFTGMSANNFYFGVHELDVKFVTLVSLIKQGHVFRDGDEAQIAAELAGIIEQISQVYREDNGKTLSESTRAYDLDPAEIFARLVSAYIEQRIEKHKDYIETKADHSEAYKTVYVTPFTPAILDAFEKWMFKLAPVVHKIQQRLQDEKQPEILDKRGQPVMSSPDPYQLHGISKILWSADFNKIDPSEDTTHIKIAELTESIASLKEKIKTSEVELAGYIKQKGTAVKIKDEPKGEIKDEIKNEIKRDEKTIIDLDATLSPVQRELDAILNQIDKEVSDLIRVRDKKRTALLEEVVLRESLKQYIGSKKDEKADILVQQNALMQNTAQAELDVVKQLIHDLELAGGIDERSSAEIYRLTDELTRLMKRGADERAAIQHQKTVELTDTIQKSIKSVQGSKPVDLRKPTPKGLVSQSILYSKESIKRFYRTAGGFFANNWRYRLSMLASHDKQNALPDVLDYFPSFKNYTESSTLYTNNVVDVVKNVMGIDDDKKMQRWLVEQTKASDLFMFKTRDGAINTFKGSTLDSITLWLWLKDPQTRLLLQKNGFVVTDWEGNQHRYEGVVTQYDENLDQRASKDSDVVFDNKLGLEVILEDGMTDEAKQLGLVLVDFLAKDYYPRVNEWHRDSYGFNLPQVEMYFPRQVEYTEDETKKDIQSFWEHQMVSVSADSIFNRGMHSHKLKIDNALAIVFNHIAKTEFMINYDGWYKKVLAVMVNPDFRDIVTRKYGKPVLDEMSDHFDQIIKQYIQLSAMFEPVLGGLRRNISMAFIALNPKSSLKQIMSFTVYSAEVPTAKFSAGIAKFALNPLKNAKMLFDSSDLLRKRHGNMLIELTEAVKDKKFRNFLTKRDWRSHWYVLVKYGDAVNVAAGGFAAYEYHKSLGLSHEQAIGEVEKLIYKYNMSTNIEELSNLQRGGSLDRFLAQFNSDAIKVWNALIDTHRSFLRGSIDLPTYAKRVLLLQIVHPLLMLACNFSPLSKRGLTLGIIAGSTNVVPFIGAYFPVAALAAANLLFGEPDDDDEENKEAAKKEKYYLDSLGVEPFSELTKAVKEIVKSTQQDDYFNNWFDAYVRVGEPVVHTTTGLPSRNIRRYYLNPLGALLGVDIDEATRHNEGRKKHADLLGNESMTIEAGTEDIDVKDETMTIDEEGAKQ
jgi:hypothetical protein